MLEVHSPVPLTEGESIMFGINTHHLINFAIGLAVSSPISIIAMILLPMFGEPRWGGGVIAMVIGLLFAVIKLKDRPLAELLNLSVRFSLRPKLVTYDREYRIHANRKKGDFI